MNKFEVAFEDALQKKTIKMQNSEFGLDEYTVD
jgi:hypothetical protein